MLRKTLLFAAIFYTAWNLQAQAPLYAIVAEPMLDARESYLITDMELDTNGLIWATTENAGILRHNGERFIRMDKPPEKSDDEVYYTALTLVRPKFWLAAGKGVYAWKGKAWESISFPEDHCVDLLNTGMGRIYALTTSHLYYRLVSQEDWKEEEIPGLQGAFQIIQKEGILLIASESGLWMRSPTGMWTQMLDEPVSSAMPLGQGWLAVTQKGLKWLSEEGWTLIAPEVQGYQSHVVTADGENTWLIGESGLWYVRQDGAALRLYTQGGLALNALRHGMASDAGGLCIATEKGLIRIDQPERWFDLRTLPYRMGMIAQLAEAGADSCWVSTPEGVFAVGPKRIHSLPKPGPGLVTGLSTSLGAWAYGEFGLQMLIKGKWQSTAVKEWVQDLRSAGDTLFVRTLAGWVAAKKPGLTSVFVPWLGPEHKQNPETDPHWVKDVFGLALEASPRSVGKALPPALLIWGVERRTKKENDPVVLRVGFRGLPAAGAGISISYQINDGDWVNLGDARRLVLDRLRAGRYTVRFKAELPNAERWGQPSMIIEVLPAAWKRPEYWIPVLGMGLLFMSLLSYFVYRRLRDRRAWQREKAQLERMALRLQMNPHFTFNALESISAFVLQKQPKEAVTYLNKFSKLMRYTLENAEEAYVSLEREKNALENYIALEQMRFDQGFLYVLQMEEGLDLASVRIPPMLIQPLVENAILHGLRPKMKPGEALGVLKLSMSQTPHGNALYIQVEDNGIGRVVSRQQKSGDEGKKRSMATHVLESRLQALQLETGKVHSVKVEDLNEGTRVTLVLPLMQEWDGLD